MARRGCVLVGITRFTDDERTAISDRAKFRARFLALALALGMFMIARPWPSGQYAVTAGWILFTAYVFFCWTSAFHETAHQTFSLSSFRNLWLGRLLGTLMFAPYDAYRETHIRHHAYLNQPDDWELWPYCDPGRSLWFRRIFVWLDLLFGIVTAPIIYGRIYFHPNSPVTDPTIRRRIRNEYIAIIVFWGGLWTVTTVTGTWMLHAKMVLLPIALAGLIQNGRKLTEHLGMASYDPLLGTRTVVPNNPLIKLLSFLNFNIFVHGPHHRHARIPLEELQPRMESYIRDNPHVKYPVYPTYRSATLAMTPCLFKNPGCGINAGAQPPAEPIQADVQDFVTDVVDEVLGEERVTAPTAGD